MVQLFVNLVLAGPVSQRAAASVLKLLTGALSCDLRLPCANSGRLWMARLGLYALRCEKPRADDWVWMIDHTIQLGPWKCLVIVGIRLSEWQRLERPLCHQDLSLLNLTPMIKADKEAVAEQLQRTYEELGMPTAVVSDEGAELKSGMRLFQQRHEGTAAIPPHVHDIKHKAAALLKKELHGSDAWNGFVKHLSRTRLAVTLTALAFLNPPRLSNKARFMNLGACVNWGHHVLQYLNDPQDFPDEPIDREKLQTKLGWIRAYEDSLVQWRELLAIIDATEKYVRRNGYHGTAHRDLQQLLEPLATQAASQRLTARLLEHVQQEGNKLPVDLRMPGHTEVLESLLGKYKQTQARHSQGGMTASLLNIGAAVLDRTPDVIADALTNTPVDDVLVWVRQKLGQTVASKRRLALK